MELRQKTVLEVKIDDRVYSMECYSDSPLGCVHDALSQMKAYVVSRINEMQEKESQPKEENVQESNS